MLLFREGHKAIGLPIHGGLIAKIRSGGTQVIFGDLWCRLRDGDRVDIGGYAVTYAAGELLVEPGN